MIALRDGSRPAAPAKPPQGAPDHDAGHGNVRIRCPRCQWRHDFQPHWGCERCFTTFDTFLTRAHCPRCDNSWRSTWCPSCHRPSPHDDWYVAEDGGGPPS